MSQDGYSQHESDRDYPAENGNGVHAEDEPYGQQEVDQEVAPPAPTVGQVARKKLMGYVGFANLPNQVHRKRYVHVLAVSA